MVINLFTEFIIVGLILFILRTRKWMEFFTLDVLLPNQGGANGEQQTVGVDITTSEIPKDWMLNSSINRPNMDAIVNRRPINKYKHIKYLTPEKVVLLNYSHNNWIDLEEKISNSNFKAAILGSAQIGIEEVPSDEEEV